MLNALSNDRQIPGAAGGTPPQIQPPSSVDAGSQQPRRLKNRFSALLEPPRGLIFCSDATAATLNTNGLKHSLPKLEATAVESGVKLSMANRLKGGKRLPESTHQDADV